jgi:hypothetical protein
VGVRVRPPPPRRYGCATSVVGVLTGGMNPGQIFTMLPDVPGSLPLLTVPSANIVWPWLRSPRQAIHFIYTGAWAAAAQPVSDC